MELVLFYTFLSKNRPDKIEAFFNGLPDKLKNNISEYRDAQERGLRICSKYLVEQAFQVFYPFRNLDWNTLKKNKNSKPFLEESDFHFSSSHSGDLCVVAANVEYECGIDTELLKPIDITLYKDFLHAEEWDHLQSSGNLQKDFYAMWTRKEAVLKAAGLGIAKDLSEVNTRQKHIWIESRIFCTQEIVISNEYKIFTAAEVQADIIRLQEIIM